MDALLAWLTSLPTAALYLALAVTAAAENIFPPLPADTVVAFGAFLAARGNGTALGSFLATWLGNLVGAAVMYGVGHRFGASWIKRVFARYGTAGSEARLESLYARRGIWAIFLSRFLPGARAIVPPFAGALRIPFWGALAAMGVASGIWYGAITYLAFTAGASFDELRARIAASQRIVGVVAALLAIAIALIWWIRRSRRST
jgi:membrane protein DedA with SNARE-associated domain